MNVAKEIVALKAQSPGQLRARYAEVFGEETRSCNKAFLVKRIAWRLQSLAEGDLSERAKSRAAELAHDADIRVTAPKAPAASPGAAERTRVGPLRVPADRRLPMPGTVLTRAYKGRTLEVTVLPHGFEFEGEVYGSLSAIAKAVTGSQWNGFHFFGLTNGGGNHA